MVVCFSPAELPHAVSAFNIRLLHHITSFTHCQQTNMNVSVVNVCCP